MRATPPSIFKTIPQEIITTRQTDGSASARQANYDYDREQEEGSSPIYRANILEK